MTAVAEPTAPVTATATIATRVRDRARGTPERIAMREGDLSAQLEELRDSAGGPQDETSHKKRRLSRSG